MGVRPGRRLTEFQQPSWSFVNLLIIFLLAIPVLEYDLHVESGLEKTSNGMSKFPPISKNLKWTFLSRLMEIVLSLKNHI